MYHWSEIFIGIQLCITIQLVVVGSLNVFTKNTKNVFLGIYCLLVANAHIALIFSDFFKKEPYMYAFFGGWKGYFYGPVLYLYLKSLSKKWNHKKEWIHLILPFALFGLSLYRYFFISQEDSMIVKLKAVGYFFYWTLLISYFILGIKEFKQHIRINLKEKSKIRFQSFYTIVNTHLLFTIIPGFILFLSIYTDVSIIENLTEAVVLPYYEYWAVPIYMLLFIFLLFYGITELQWVKKYFLIASIHQPVNDFQKNADVFMHIKEFFSANEVFKNPNLTIDELSLSSGVTKSAIRSVLIEKGYSSFTDFVNEYRIKEFKNNLKEEKYNNYDLASIALLSGFNSKATFYRVFKKHTGMTPNEYKASVISNKLLE